jgi:hypothetical protein
MHKTQADEIRSFAGRQWVFPAKQHGDNTFTIVSGEVHRSMGLRDRMPNVCSALGSREFLNANGLTLVSREGPPSGKSSTVRFTYAFRGDAESGGAKPASEGGGWDAFLALRGVAREVFEGYGGGEEFLRNERAAFVSPIGERSEERDQEHDEAGK